jgi:ribonucleoside-diphosphate reductase alpha chain
MSELAVIKDKWHNSTTERVQTPDGTFFVHIVENENGRPIMIQVSGSKAGTAVAAWCDALARTITIALQSGVDWTRFIEELSSITSSRALRLVKGAICRSGPEGIAIALMRYRDGKHEELIAQEELDDSDDESEDIRPRWKVPPELR